MMKAVAEHTKLEPFQREKEQNIFLKVLNDFILRLPQAQQMVKIALTSQLKALIMDRPKITFGNKGSLVPNEKGNFFVKGKILDTEKANFSNWVIIYEKDPQFAKEVETALYNAGETIGVTFDYA